MASRTAILCTFLILIVAIRTACLVLTTPSRIPEEWLRPRIDADAETLLAFGAQIPLACADISDLELIPGVSDNLAKELLDKRTRIIAHARNYSPHEALQLARGVGAHKAEVLSSRLSLEDACYQGESYIPFEIPHTKPTPYSALRLSSSRN